MKTIFDNIYILHCLTDSERHEAIQQKFKYLGLTYEYIYALPLIDIFNNPDTENILNITNKQNFWKHGEKNVRYWSVAMGHYMCVYQAYCLGYQNILIFEDDIVINTDKDLVFRYLNDVPDDADIIRYGYMQTDNTNTKRFDNTKKLFYKDNENNDYRYYGIQCYALMNRKTMKIFLDSCNYCFHGNEDVENIFRKNKYNLNIYYATKPLFLDSIAYNKNNACYKIPYSDKLLNKYIFMK